MKQSCRDTRHAIHGLFLAIDKLQTRTIFQEEEFHDHAVPNYFRPKSLLQFAVPCFEGGVDTRNRAPNEWNTHEFSRRWAPQKFFLFDPLNPFFSHQSAPVFRAIYLQRILFEHHHLRNFNGPHQNLFHHESFKNKRFKVSWKRRSLKMAWIRNPNFWIRAAVMEVLKSAFLLKNFTGFSFHFHQFFDPLILSFGF